MIIASFGDLVKRLIQAEGIDGFSDLLPADGAEVLLRLGSGFTKSSIRGGKCDRASLTFTPIGARMRSTMNLCGIGCVVTTGMGCYRRAELG